MRAGEVARRAGVSVETLRYYERRRLLPEPPRGAGGHRRYDEDAVRFVRAIKDAQAIGFTLAEIEEYLRAVRRGRVPAPEAMRVRMAAKIDEIDARIAALRRMRDELARIVGCACESLDHCTCGAAYLARRGHEATARPAPLHVTNGESAGNTLRQTSLGGAVLPWQDVLHEGPVPAGPRPGLLRARPRRGNLGLGCAAPPRPHSARGVRDGGRSAAAVPGPGPAAAARGAPGAAGRPVGDRATGAAGNRRRSDQAASSVSRHTGP